jgi:predicted Zn finger-like uncharacterized protein
MLTQCPNCQTMYQISAAELGAAKGFVKCGECASQFNALDRIADEPQFDPRGPQQRAIEVEEEKPAPTFVLMEDQDSELIDSRPQNESPDQMVSLATAQDELNPASPDQNITYAPEELEELDKTQELALLTDNGATPQNTVGEREEHAQILSRMPVGAAPASLSSETHETLFHDPELDEAHGAEKISPNAGTPLEPEIDLDDVPAILQEELLAMAQTKNNAAPWYWTLLAFSLSIGVILQLGWHYREPMLARFPGMQSSMEGMCSVLGCEVLQQQPVEPIQLLTRDVRTHPRYENALLVNASMLNSGEETIDFPTVQLGLFDPTGTAIGIRQFSPPEYLDKSIDMASGIPPGRSVHVILELANTGDRASSFEFSFHK